MSGLPPIYLPNGDVEEMDDDALYIAWAGIFLRDRAGGWHPDSLPGKQALAEFEAFIRETQARAIEVFVATQRNISELTMLKAAQRIADIREGRTDLSGNKLT